MSRSLMAVVMLGWMVGIAGVGTADPPTQSEATSGMVSIDMVEAGIGDVIRAVTTASGASIVMAGDVTGTITLCMPRAGVDQVLERICLVKGLYWWKDGSGTYFVSAHPQPGSAVGSVTLPGLLPRDTETHQMHTLQFVSPQYVVYQLGLSDDPGPEPYMRDPDFAKSLYGAAPGGLGELAGRGGGGGGGRGGGGGGGGARGGGGGGGAARSGGGGGGAVGGAGRGGGAGGGDLGTFLPEGISEIVAYPMLNSLLIRGTEEGIDRFIEFLKLIDRKPQQIVIEIQAILVSEDVLKSYGFSWFYNVGNLVIQPLNFSTAPYSMRLGYRVPGNDNFSLEMTYLLTSGQGKVTDAIRVATMNLLPATNQVTTFYPVVTGSSTVAGTLTTTVTTSTIITTYTITTNITITPRINGDGTVTMYIPYTKSDITDFIVIPLPGGGQSTVPIITTNTITTNLNVRDGETFVLGGFVSDRNLEKFQKMPILGDLPVIGRLFNKRELTKSNAETLIFITPRIIKEEAAPATLGPI